MEIQIERLRDEETGGERHREMERQMKRHKNRWRDKETGGDRWSD